MSETLARLFRHAISYDKPDALLVNEDGRYRPISSRELYRRVGRLHLDLKKVGIGKGDRCALLSENRWEWAVADFAMMTAGIVSVPIYPTLTADQIHFLLEHSESRVVLVSSQLQLNKILAIWENLPRLDGVVAFDDVESADPRVINLSTLIGSEPLADAERETVEASINDVKPDDLASLIYTSGTTGTPKGVMLSHGNIASNVRDVVIDVRSSDTCLSFLPLSHVAERTADYIFFHAGATVAYAESIETVPQNMQEVRPMIALGVPRFFEKVHARVLGSVEGSSVLRRKLFHWAVETGKAAAPYQLENKPLPGALKLQLAIAKALVFKTLHKRLGGRFRFFASGAAPLARHLAEFFYAVGIPICEAYGLTETSPVVSINTTTELRFGTVGKVIRNVEVKIADDGEILVRGPNVMQGYYKEPERTAEVIKDRWFHTGDLGSFDADGYLSIRDRKKDLFKTSGGKYIAPQPIENHLKLSPYVSMAVIVAEGRRFPSVLIIPNFERLKVFAEDHDLPTANMSELVERPEVQALFIDEVNRVCADLAQYERPKKAIILDRELTIEDGEITPSMKVRRRAVEMKFARQIDELYAE